MIRRALAVAVALVVPGLVVAQAPSDALFRSYAGATTPVALGPLSADAPAALPAAGSAGEESDEGEGAGTTQPGWFASNQRYAIGGVAALAAGVALTQFASGAQAVGVGADPAAAPTAFGVGAMPAGVTLGPLSGASPLVIINPEPGTVLLLGTGLGGLLFVARRRRGRS